MNLALRDVRHNAFRFVLTALGLGGLLGIVIAMAGIYAGALDDALRLPRASNPDLWVVQPRTKGPFAEPSRIPADTRELVRRIPGVAEAGAVTFQTVQTTANGKPLRLFIQGYEPGRPGGPAGLLSGHGITASHYGVAVRSERHLVAKPQPGRNVGDDLVYPGVEKTAVARQIDRWKHLSAVSEQQEEDYLTVFVISIPMCGCRRARARLGLRRWRPCRTT